MDLSKSVPILMGSLCMFASMVGATTVERVSFQDLAYQAEFIFMGEVINLDHSEGVVGNTVLPFTFVTYRVDQVAKGSSAETAQFTLQMEGGPTKDGRYMEVVGTPSFNVGDRDILFVAGNGQAIMPLVGWAQGRLSVQDQRIHDEYGRELRQSPGGELVFVEASIAPRGEQSLDTPPQSSLDPVGKALAVSPAQGFQLIEALVKKYNSAEELARLRPTASISELRARNQVRLQEAAPPTQSLSSSELIDPLEQQERLMELAE